MVALRSCTLRQISQAPVDKIVQNQPYVNPDCTMHLAACRLSVWHLHGVLSILEGCWVSEWKRSSEWSNRVHFMSQDRLCFNRNGEGSLTVTARQGKNNVFRGKARARFSGTKIIIKTGTAKGRNGEVWTPSTLELKGTGRSSMCFHVAVNPDNPKHVRRSKFRLFRD